SVMKRNPTRSRRRIQQRVEYRPVGDGIAAVLHRFGLPEQRRDRSALEMVPPDHNWCSELPGLDEVIQPLTTPSSFATSEPADARRRPLEPRFLACEVNPAVPDFVLGKQCENKLVGYRNVRRTAGQGCPAERPSSFGEHRPNVCRHETGKIVGILYA